MPRLECNVELTEAKEPGPRLPGPQTVILGTYTETNKLWHSSVCTVAEIHTKYHEAGKSEVPALPGELVS